ncbi:hypothetical protein [Legionella sp. CNM-4043-24]|uniref:hypothetical protein n=1 Tax=Legionella sp. CNM-4043-24 TaxID=3421646 RepID=UPI00403AEC12
MESAQETGSQLAALSGNDYYNRVVVLPQDTPDQHQLRQLIEQSRAKLAPVIRTFLGILPPFDPGSQQDVGRIIKQLEYQIQHFDRHSPRYAIVKQQLALMHDLNKINGLRLVNIPGENGAPDRLYCQLTESTSGVTEKIALISFDTVRQRLQHLADSEFHAPQDYVDQRGQYALRTDAILKLPKHKDIREIQRESMALNASRLLNLDTTDSTTVCWNGKPALFVPFDSIRLLQEYAQGETLHTFGLGHQTYQHYATINPVGAGLEANRYVEDFGKSLALFALCQDTDAVGGYLQNKALKQSDTGQDTLYIFDQVMMDREKMTLDSRLSLQPSEFLMKHTRHGQGRNRTLIEDSSITEKFASLMTLKSQAVLLDQYAQRSIDQHNEEMRNLQRERPTNYQSMLEDILILRNDALNMKKTMARRVAQIDKALPARDAGIGDQDLRQSLILEKLLHNPQLFTDSGRPYRNPWTQRHTNPVKHVSQALESETVNLMFTTSVDPAMIAFIKSHDCRSLTQINSNTLQISRQDLARLTETKLYPEQNEQIDPKARYLNLQDLQRIQLAYKSGNRSAILKLVQGYEQTINKAGASLTERLNELNKMERSLNHHIASAKHPGFARHVMKKFQCDAQQRLRQLVPTDRRALIEQAFTAARRLDRMAEFNQVLAAAIRGGHLYSESYSAFLDTCIQRENMSGNHHDALANSEHLRLRSSELLARLNPESVIKNSAPVNQPAQRFAEFKSNLGRILSSMFGTESLQADEPSNNKPSR